MNTGGFELLTSVNAGLRPGYPGRALDEGPFFGFLSLSLEQYRLTRLGKDRGAGRPGEVTQ